MSEFKSSGEFATTWVGGLGLIQGEEIVRCRDCKYYATNIHGSYCVKSITTINKPDGFCAWGERKQ